MTPRPIHRLRRTPVGALLAVLLSAGLALACAGSGIAATPPEQERLGRILPELAGALPLGMAAGGAWTGTVAGEEYVLRNRNSAASIYYGYLLRKEPSEQGLSVEVSLPRRPATGLSGAGLLFGFAPGGPRYCAFVLHPDGVAGLYARDGEGFHPLQRVRPQTFRTDGPNMLRLDRTASSVKGFVNGRQVLEVAAAEACPAAPRTADAGGATAVAATAANLAGAAPAGYEGAGIIALSLGSFGFSDFVLR